MQLKASSGFLIRGLFVTLEAAGITPGSVWVLFPVQAGILPVDTGICGARRGVHARPEVPGLLPVGRSQDDSHSRNSPTRQSPIARPESAAPSTLGPPKASPQKPSLSSGSHRQGSGQEALGSL